MIAVIPAAGEGARMAEITQGRAKELLEVGGQPVLSWVIVECLAAGAERIVVVSSSRKPDLTEFVSKQKDSRIEMAWQEEAVGLADAVSKGLREGEPVLVPMADTIFVRESPCLALAQAVEHGAYGAAAVREVPTDRVSQYGVFGFDTNGVVNEVVEKPSPEAAPSRWAIASRFALSAEAVSDLLEMTARTAPGFSLSDLFQVAIRKGKRIEAVRLSAEVETYDCGSPEGYRQARTHLG